MNRTEIIAKLRLIKEILNSSESAEISPATISALNNIFSLENETESSDRVAFDSVITIIDYLQSRVKVMQQRAKNTFRLIEANNNTARFLEQYLIKCLKDKKIDRLETERHDLEIIADNSQRELIVKEDISIIDVPEEYQKLFLKIDDYLVRQTLESGEKLDFALLKEQEFHLKIDKRGD